MAIVTAIELSVIRLFETRNIMRRIIIDSRLSILLLLSHFIIIKESRHLLI